MKLPGWRIIHLHCPKQRLKVKRMHMRILLTCGGLGLLWFHHYMPEHETTWAVALNACFALDPTA